MRIAIIGGGLTGTTLGYYLSRDAHEVLLFEKNPTLGGQTDTATTPAGIVREKFLHLLSPDDAELLTLLEQLDLRGEIVWGSLRAGLLRDGTVLPNTGMADLVRFRRLMAFEKLRLLYARAHLLFKRDWRKLDKISAKEWLIRHAGLRAYEFFWRHLAELNSNGHVYALPLAWIWAYEHARRRQSARGGFRERWGYWRSSSRKLFDSLAGAIRRNGGSIHTGRCVERIAIDQSRVRAVRVEGADIPVDLVIATVPIPALKPLAPELIARLPEKIRQMNHASLLSIVLELKRPLSPYFRIMASNTDLPFLDIIELSQLTGRPGSITPYTVYIRSLITNDHTLYNADDQSVVRALAPHLAAVRPGWNEGDILHHSVYRLDIADPYYFLNYASTMPPHRTPIPGLLLANTCQIYPAMRTLNATLINARAAAACV